jgi:hypothetical protein
MKVFGLEHFRVLEVDGKGDGVVWGGGRAGTRGSSGRAVCTRIGGRVGRYGCSKNSIVNPVCTEVVLIKKHPLNPSSNELPKGISEEDLVSGIEISGYPLQGIVAEFLTEGFKVIEEWGYIDKDTKEHRSLDIFAEIKLPEIEGKVDPSLILLIECKKSAHPYVFFKNIVESKLNEFPIIAGVQVSIKAYDGGYCDPCPITKVLNLEEENFQKNGPFVCSSCSQAIPNGKKVDLSGGDFYNKVILPLIKAHHHAKEIYKSRIYSNTTMPTMIIPIVVIDAPLILIDSPKRGGGGIAVVWGHLELESINPPLRVMPRAPTSSRNPT